MIWFPQLAGWFQCVVDMVPQLAGRFRCVDYGSATCRPVSIYRRYGIAICRKIFTVFSPLATAIYLRISAAMSTEPTESTEATEQWDVLFYNILVEHADQYVEARGDADARETILEACVEAITNSPLYREKEGKIDLPKDLSAVNFSFNNVCSY